MSKHPIQPIEKDKSGTPRFKRNKLVEHLLDYGGLDMNDLARRDFPAEDRQQFAQLIGYSLGGYGELSYVSDETHCTAERMYETGESEMEARIKVLQAKLDTVETCLRELVPQIFRIHPDDLTT